MEVEHFMKFSEADVDPEAPQVSLELTIRPELYLNTPFTIWSTLRYEPPESEIEERPVTILWSSVEVDQSLLLLRQTQDGFEEVKIPQDNDKPSDTRNEDNAPKDPEEGELQQNTSWPHEQHISNGVDRIDFEQKDTSAHLGDDAQQVLNGSEARQSGSTPDRSATVGGDEKDMASSAPGVSTSQADTIPRGAGNPEPLQAQTPSDYVNGDTPSHPPSAYTTIPPFSPLETTSTLPSHILPHLIPGETYILLYPGCSIPWWEFGTKALALQNYADSMQDGESKRKVVIPAEHTVEFTIFEKEVETMPLVEEPEDMGSPIDFVPTRLGRSNTVPSFRMSFHE